MGIRSWRAITAAPLLSARETEGERPPASDAMRCLLYSGVNRKPGPTRSTPMSVRASGSQRLCQCAPAVLDAPARGTNVPLTLVLARACGSGSPVARVRGRSQGLRAHPPRPTTGYCAFGSYVTADRYLRAACVDRAALAAVRCHARTQRAPPAEGRRSLRMSVGAECARCCSARPKG